MLSKPEKTVKYCRGCFIMKNQSLVTVTVRDKKISEISGKNAKRT